MRTYMAVLCRKGHGQFMELTNISVIKELFLRHGFSFSGKLGQNFLINPSVCPKIAELGGCCGEVGALEIGTGVGVLTKELALRAKKVVAIEIDTSLKPILDETLAEFDNVEIIYGDVLKVDLAQIIRTHFGDMQVVCCANLPYYITSPVIMRLLEERLPLSSITVMVQKEAAERITAAPATRECGAISIAVNYYATAHKLFAVNRGSFMPKPNVDSAVIKIDVAEKYQLTDMEHDSFFRLVKAAFSQRRKQIVNPVSAQFSISKEGLREMMAQCGIKDTARAEEIEMEQLLNLGKMLSRQ